MFTRPALRLLSRATLQHSHLRPALPRPYTTTATTSAAPRTSNPFNTVALHSLSVLLGAGLLYSLMELYNPQRIEPPASSSSHLTTSPDEAYLTQLRNEQDNLPVVKKLRSDPALVEVNAYSLMSISAREHSLTASTLRGKGKVALEPLTFRNKDSTEWVAVMNLGRNLCGHDGIVHGGMLATIVDEMLALVTIPSLPNQVGFTANLNVNYRVPTRAEQWVVVRAKLDHIDGRKGYGMAWIESANGRTKYVDATALYICPKYAIPNLEM